MQPERYRRASGGTEVRPTSGSALLANLERRLWSSYGGKSDSVVFIYLCKATTEDCNVDSNPGNAQVHVHRWEAGGGDLCQQSPANSAL